MRAVVYSVHGGAENLRLVERPDPSPGPGEVLVRVAVSGVNPTDWKARQNGWPDQLAHAQQAVPNQDGAGTIVAVGTNVPPQRQNQRVWIREAAWQRSEGTAQELLTIPADLAVPLPDTASFDLGASLGIPAITAHRALTVRHDGPSRLGPGTHAGLTVLVQGGAGAVGHMAIELARWAGATVIATVSSPEKADLARAAGAHEVLNYREQDVTTAAKDVDIVVEVNPVANAATDAAILALHGVVAAYASSGTSEAILPVRGLMIRNATWQFVMVYTMPAQAKQAAVEDIQAALAAQALHVGEEYGLPLHRFPLARTAGAHDAVEHGAVGKVLIDVAGTGNN